MQSLHASLNAAVAIAFGEKPNIAARLHDRSFKDKAVPTFSRRANVSWRSTKKRIVMKLHRPVPASWSTHILTSHLFGVTILSWGFKKSETGKSWKRSVASPSRENLQTTSDSQDSSTASKEIISRSLLQAENQVEACVGKKKLKGDQFFFTNRRESGNVEKKDFSHVSDDLATKSVVQGEPDSGGRRQPDEKSSNTKNETQTDSDNVGVGEREQGENELMGGNEDNDQDIPLGRKRMGRPKRKKKNARCAGIATYDSLTNSIRLKGSTPETPAAVHDKDLNQQRQRSPCLSKCQPTEQGIQGAGATSESNAGFLEEVTGGVSGFDFGNRSTGGDRSLGVEEAARLFRLLCLEDIDNSSQPNPTLVTQDDSHREQSGYGGIVQPTVESKKAVSSQEIVADGPEVALKSRPIKKLPGDKKTSKTRGFDQYSISGKWETKLKDVDIQAAASNEVDPRKDITENSQTWEHLKSKALNSDLDDVLEPVVEEVGVIIDQVTAQVNEQVQQVRSNAFVATESVTTAGQVTESISSTATQVTESVASTAAKFSSSLSQILKDGVDSEDEFQESSVSDGPEFRGFCGLRNYSVLQEDQGILVKLRDFYFFMMKKPLPEFAMGMMAAPLALSMIFTLLYLPEFQGLAYDETARDFLNAATGMDGAIGLELSWMTIFQVFMFSLSLSTGLEPDLAPLSPYTLVIANLNALIAQLILAFLSAAVFARLSQPSEPVRCSNVALICPHNKRRGQTAEALNKVLLTRCVLAGPQPCELVNVKVDLTYRFNTVPSEGSFFRGSHPLKLVRSQIALLDQGMLVRHIIDETSPLYSRTPEMLHQDDAIFVLSLAGLERSSMQPVFHVQFYSVCDEQVIWNAEFEDMVLINKKNQRVVDHSKLSSWKSL